MTSVKDIAYVAGLIEGEGCFFINNSRRKPHHKTKCFGIALDMSDEDVIIKAASILRKDSCYTINTSNNKYGGKTHYRITLSGRNAISWMMTIYPFMGLRRKSKIRSIIDEWKAYSCKLQKAFKGVVNV